MLDGQKTWIGNATFSDLTVIWARDVDDKQVKGFVVANDSPGFSTEKMEDKIALRVVQGFFNAAATVVAIAVIRDRFTGSDASRLLSRLMLVIGVAPLFAPTVGAFERT